MDSDCDASLELIRSLGVGVLSNEEYANKTSREARKAETELEELKRKSFFQISNCWTQFNITQAEANAEKEKNMVADMVARELGMFRGEMKKKEEEEAERIKNLYSSLIEKGPTPPSPRCTYVDAHGSRCVSIPNGGPLIIESPPVTFPRGPRTYETATNITNTWDKNIDFVERRCITNPSSSPSRAKPCRERLRTVIPSEIGFEEKRGVGFNDDEDISGYKKAPAKDAVDISDLRIPELNPAHNARGPSINFSDPHYMAPHKTRGAVPLTSSPAKKCPSKSILKPSAIQNADAYADPGCVTKDAEFDEMERILKLNEQKLAKLTALHF